MVDEDMTDKIRYLEEEGFYFCISDITKPLYLEVSKRELKIFRALSKID